MAYDITVKHPLYEEFLPAWQLMRDAFDGEDKIKSAGSPPGTKYLPMKSGTAAIRDPERRLATYNAYKLRAEFPELVSPTVRGSVGIMLKQAPKIELPKSMEPLLAKATKDGLSLASLHRRIAVELMVTGRYGILPGIDGNGAPYLAGYVAESIRNWDSDENDTTNYLVLDESAQKRDPATGKWGKVEKYRECVLDDNGAYSSREWVKGSGGKFDVGAPVVARTRQGVPLGFLPFVFIDTNDLTAAPDDVPLYGLGRLAVRVYRLDADYTFALHMTSEPTPWVNGFDNPVEDRKSGKIPTTIGSSVIWALPPNAEAGMLEFAGPGLAAQETAITNALNRAVTLGAQILADTSKSAESGDALRLRLGNQASLLNLIAINSAEGLQAALRNVAIWLGEDPESVTVTPNLEFFDQPISALDLNALVAGWQAGAYSYPSMFDRLKRGQIVPPDRTVEEEQELIAQDDVSRAPSPSEMGLLQGGNDQ